MKKSAKSRGILSILVLSGWIFWVLVGTSLMETTYSTLGINQTMIFFVGAMICLWYFKWQIIWSAETVAEDKNLDNLVSLIPLIPLTLSAIIVGFFDITMGTNKTFWVTNFVMFSFAWWLDISIGTSTGNQILTLKSVEQRTDI